VNDGEVLESTLAGVLDEYPRLATLGVVPLGLSRYSKEQEMRPHTDAEAAGVLDTVTRWQHVYTSVLGRRLVYAADEYYLLAGRDFPPGSDYDGFAQHENGIGMARAFVEAFAGVPTDVGGVRHGFFSWVDGAPASGYRAPRAAQPPIEPLAEAGRPITIVTGTYGARVLEPLVASHPRRDVEVLAVPNDFFGGNIGVAGLMTGADLTKALAPLDPAVRCLLPDACLSERRFLDGLTLDDLPRPVEVLPADGRSLRAVLDGRALPTPVLVS
jgi:NifB/MoaA-like Fe-S oxidoreductase